MSDDQDTEPLVAMTDDALVRWAVREVWTYAKAHPDLPPDLQLSFGILCGKAMGTLERGT